MLNTITNFIHSFFVNAQSPDLNENREPDDHAEVQEKRNIKERDGFCRRVDSYDGQVVVVDGKLYYTCFVIGDLIIF